ncbi:MAG: LuxR C-terminal-related transcriptional regulator [Bacillota bacterium]
MALFPQESGPPDYGAYLCSPAELKASYDRCRFLGVPVALERPRKILLKSLLNLRVYENDLFLAAVERVITPHHYTGPQDNHIYILCNPELAALKIFAAPEILLAAEKIGVKPGTVFTEASCGTNALALAREHNRLVAIRGEQHYCRLFKDWWCVASPVKDPAGKTVGYLDISMHAEKELGLAVALLQTLIHSIQREFLLLDCYQTKSNNNLPPAPPRIPPEVERELTPREREICFFLFRRFSNREIAEKLNLSIATVKSHRRSIYQKFGVNRLTEFLAKLSQ